MEEPILNHIQQLLPYQVKEMESGFKHLGYFLKPCNYLKSDWNWLLTKFEKRIGNETNRWLSLGGGYIMVKSVLENLPVYWLTLAKIPVHVLVKIRHHVFHFLWLGNKAKRGIHLSKWDTILSPKSYGGWDIKNIHLFGKELAAKIVWR
jgi:hypothetical protein